MTFHFSSFGHVVKEFEVGNLTSGLFFSTGGQKNLKITNLISSLKMASMQRERD